jgi:hypothetical protein
VTTHLCVAGSTRAEELDRIVHLYAATKPDAVLPTKLDEAIAIGTVLAARCRLDRPLATRSPVNKSPTTSPSPHPLLSSISCSEALAHEPRISF